MKKQVIIVDIFKSVVEKVQARYGSHIEYIYGPWEDIEASLIEIAASYGLEGGSANIGFPLIALVQDFPETREGNGGYYADVNIPLLLIATLTDNAYKAPKRYELSFKPILYPIYQLLLEEIAKNGNFIVGDPDKIDHIKWDRLYYGKKTIGTALNDYIDAIELNNLKLTVAQSC